MKETGEDSRLRPPRPIRETTQRLGAREHPPFMVYPEAKMLAGLRVGSAFAALYNAAFIMIVFFDL